ncbi:MAG: protein O-mannosyl-transferase family, partial [Ardenticatenaceae bacterium]
MPLDSNHSSFTIFGRRLNLDVALAILVGVLALALYVYTLAPSVISIADDTLEFQLVAQRGAIPHQTGYPLYALLLTLIARILPIGEVAFRANLLSALAASAAVALTYLVGRKMGMWRVAAFFSAALLATAPTFWAHATVAEVYALHFALVAALIFSVLRWPERLKSLLRVSPPLPLSPSPPLPLWAGLFFGLGLTHHSMIVLWAPAVGVYVLLVAWQYRSALRPASPPLPREELRIVFAVAPNCEFAQRAPDARFPKSEIRNPKS